MEVYKPALFLQTFSHTSLLPSSLFQGLIENFPHVGWKKLRMFDALSPLAQEPRSSHCFAARSPSLLSLFLGSHPFPAAAFRSALPVLFSEYPAKKTGRGGEEWLCFKTPRITHLIPSSLFYHPSFHYPLSISQGWTFTSPLLCSASSNYCSLELHYFSSYKDGVKIEFMEPNYIFSIQELTVYFTSQNWDRWKN